MNKFTEVVVLNILSKEYKITCEPQERHDLIHMATQLDKQMRQIRDSGKVNGAERIAVMAALNLAHDLYVVKNQNDILKIKLDEALATMSHKIENVLENG